MVEVFRIMIRDDHFSFGLNDPNELGQTLLGILGKAETEVTVNQVKAFIIPLESFCLKIASELSPVRFGESDRSVRADLFLNTLFRRVVERSQDKNLGVTCKINEFEALDVGVVCGFS